MNYLENLEIVSEQEVMEKNIPLEQLWLVEADGDIHGPYFRESLDQLSEKYPDFFEITRVCNIADGKWQNFFESNAFQRRKPQIVDASSFDPESTFYYLVSGQKHGPIGFEKLCQMVESGEIKKQDQFCVKGKPWMKIYQHPEFDRRSQSIDLPFKRPNDDDFLVSNLEIMQNQKINHDEDTIINLAFLDKQKDGHSFNYDPVTTFNFVKEDKPSFNYSEFFKSKTISYSAGFAFVLICLIVMFGSSSDPKNMASRKIASKGKKSATSNDYKSQVDRPSQTTNKAAAPRYNNSVTRRDPIKNVVKARKTFQYRPKPAKRIVTHPKPNNMENRSPANESDNFQDPRDDYKEETYQDERDTEERVNEVAQELEPQNDDAYSNHNDF